MTYTFKKHDEVAFTAESRRLARNDEKYLGVFTVLDVSTNLKGAAPLAHPQSVLLRDHGWVSGHLVESIHHVEEPYPYTYEPIVMRLGF